MGKLSNYTRRHDHPYTVSLPNGKGTIQILFYEGYITVRSYQPGLHYATEIHVKRGAWIKLLRKAIPITRLMEGPSFDRYRAERRYYRAEEEHLAELRAQKAERRGPRSRRRVRSRSRRGQA